MIYVKTRFSPFAVLGCFLFLCGIGIPPLMQAESLDHLRSNSYIIQLGNFNITAGEKSSSSYTVTDTVGQVAPGEYGTTGYKVYAGFQYIYAIPSFSFRIPDLSIDLGELVTNSFSTDTNQLIITTRSGGYSILARASNPLKKPGASGASLAFTSCDTPCTTTTAESWTNPSNVGFGFSVSGTHKSSDFISSSYFRPFADRSISQAAQTIASHNGVVRDDVLTVTYKATIPGSQEAGRYETSVDYTAVPTY